MKIKIMIFLFVLSFSMWMHGVSLANRDDNMEPANGFFLEKGNPAAGRNAFKEFKCNACHNVQGDKEFTVSSGLGPALGAKQADYASGWIANSMVSPSHAIALDAVDPGDNVPSKMTDFKDKMTVRQLIDLVSYIKSLEPEEKKTGESLPADQK